MDKMDVFTKFNEQNKERDRLFRLLQYTAKLVAGVTEGVCSNDTCLYVRCKNVERSISFCRQMLRFGQFMQSGKASLASISNLENPSMINTFNGLANVSDGLYVLCDNIVWLAKCGLFDIDQSSYSNLSDSFWLYSVILFLMRNLCQALLIYQNTPRSIKDNTVPLPTHVRNFVAQNKILSFDILRNLCDICICMASLDRMKLSPATVGFAGVVGSLVPFLKSKYVNYN